MKLYFKVPPEADGALLRSFLRRCSVSADLSRAVKFRGSGFFADGVPILANRRAAVALIDKLADAVGKNVRESGEQMDPVLRDGITIDHLTYGYHESAPVLNDVSVRFEAGKSYAIVGTSGSECGGQQK